MDDFADDASLLKQQADEYARLEMQLLDECMATHYGNNSRHILKWLAEKLKRRHRCQAETGNSKQEK